MIRRRAFTLLEVLIVLVLLAILAAILWPDFATAQQGEQLSESVTRTKALVAMCRAQAMNEARRYRIVFRPDGRMQVRCQEDPVQAPDSYIEVRQEWAELPFLLEDVWIAALLPLPQGPPPILVDDEVVEFEELEAEPVAIEEFEDVVNLDFYPDGTSGSARWVLRDVRGRNSQMTLDGRLGRIEIVELDPVAAGPAPKRMEERG